MSKERRWPLMALGLMLGCSTGTLSHSVDETSPSGDGSRTDTTVQRDGGATDLATPTDAVSLPDLPPLECREDEQCSAKAPRTDCIGGRCVEPAGRVQCRDDDHCAGSPATPRCWAGVCIAKPPEQRITAAPNTWTKIEQSDSGGRTGPIFAYVPQIDRYVVSTGVPRSTKHFETEHLDISGPAYTNAYPPDAPATFTPAVGPTQAPSHPPSGFPGFAMQDKAGTTRIPFYGGAYATPSNAYYQWVYVPDRQKIYAYMHNHTLAYDPRTRTWEDLAPTPTPSDHPGTLKRGARSMMWGALGFDPVHHELVLIGGSAQEEHGTPGTWVYSLDDNTWKRLALGSAPINAAREQVSLLQQQSQGLIGRLRNRRFRTESATESQRNLVAAGAALETAIGRLVATFDPAQLPTAEREQGERAAAHLSKAQVALAQLGLTATVSAQQIAKVQAAREALQWAHYALAVEPPPRALSQLAYHRATASLILFGGDGLDRAYADTWVYDCATRRWSQRYPSSSPSPRAGHALVTLPKADKIALVGGYTLGNGHSYLYRDAYKSGQAEVWVYDPPVNRWQKVAVDPAQLPSSPAATPLPVAVNQDDVLVLFGSGKTRTTWVLALDSTQLDADGQAAKGVAAETLLYRADEDSPKKGYRSYDPAFYDRQQVPAAHSLDALASTIASNTWTKVVADKGVDKAGWGTSAYDPDRRQVLYWGGGHSEYKGTNVMHYSAATNRWSLSDRPDWVLEWTGGFLCPTGLSFNNRPMVPVHGYQAYAYDTLSQELLVQSTTAVWRYDTARRRWIWPPIDAPFRADVMRVSFETTPHGLIVWGNPKAYDGALYRYDPEEKSFEQLPLNGGPIERPWCDGSGLAYDSKRDVLWLATETLHRYDMGSGTLTKAGVTKPSVLGKYALWREQVYVPDADLVLLMRRFGTDEGRFNVAYDPQANKYVSIELPFDDGAERSFSWSSALMYDPASKLVLLHNPISFWVLKLDRSTASISDL